MQHQHFATLQGKDCFGIFMEWGLPRQVLKDVWQVVAGDESYLSQQGFVSCLYLMDLAKQGRPIPNKLPPGTFPPGFRVPQAPARPAADSSASFNLGSVQRVLPVLLLRSQAGPGRLFWLRENIDGSCALSREALQSFWLTMQVHDVFTDDLPTPALPKKAAFMPPTAKDGPSQVPGPPEATLETLDPLQRQRLQNDSAQAATVEADLRKVHLACTIMITLHASIANEACTYLLDGARYTSRDGLP